MNIIMMGAQGTGKGTLCGELMKRLDLPQVSTGDIFRKNISEKTELGILADSYISKGNLVPDEVTINMVEERLKEPDAANGVMLDGFPRNLAQAEKLDEILAKKGEKVDYVINLTLPMEEIMSRILNRRICSNSECKEIYNLASKPTKVEGICDKCGSPVVQRQDDSDKEAVEKRLNTYFTQTAPLIDYYEKQGVVYSVDVNRAPSEIADEVYNYIKE